MMFEVGTAIVKGPVTEKWKRNFNMESEQSAAPQGTITTAIELQPTAFKFEARQKNSWVDSGSGSLPSE
jgi:hypothetical protein